MRAILLVAAALGLVGCGAPNNGTAVLLTIDVDATVSDADLARITELSIDVTGAELFHKNVDLTRPLARTERILYKAKASTGTLTFVIAAGDQISGIAHGMTMASLASGSTVAASVSLDNGALPDMGAGDGMGGLGVTPAAPIIGTMRPLQFTATEAVTWAVMEASGGSIDAQGNYLSPAQTGSYHVVATSTADATRTATVTVSVVPLKLKLVAGHLGGGGNADGTGAAARFSAATDVQYTSNGGQWLIVADRNNSVIRRIDVGNGAVTTLAGSPGQPGSADGTGAAARFNQPNALTIDGGHKLAFVADGAHLIRQVALDTGVVSTVNAMFMGSIGGIAYDGAQYIYYSDTAGNRIYRAAAGLSGSTLIAGNGTAAEVDNNVGGSASFTAPGAVTFDAANNRLIVADAATLRTVSLSTTANFPVATLTGTDSSWQNAEGLVVSGQTLYASTNQCIHKATLGAGTVLSAAAIAAGVCMTAGAADGAPGALSSPRNLSVDFNGNVFIADAGNDAIRQLSAAGQLATVAGAAGAIGQMNGSGNAATFKAPFGVATDGITAYVGETDAGDIRKVDLASGTVTTLVPGAPAVKTPAGLLLYMGALWAVDGGNHTLVKFDASSGAMTVMAGINGTSGATNGFATNATFNTPVGLTSDGNGTFYIADSGNNVVRSYNVATTEVKTVAGSGVAGAMNGPALGATFNTPFDVAFAGGAVYVADLMNHVVRKIDLATATVSSYAGSGVAGNVDGTGVLATLTQPTRLASDGHSLFFNSGKSGTAVRRIDLTTAAVTTFVGTIGRSGVQPGTLPASLNAPAGMAVTPGGDLVILDFNEGTVLLLASP